MNTNHLFTDEFFQDPYPVYRRMREQESAHWMEIPSEAVSGGAWMVTRYDDVKEILRKAQDTSIDIKRLVPESQRNAFHYMLLYSDPPDHTRLRNLISTPFTQVSVNGFTDLVTRRVDQLIDVLLEKQEVNFLADFAEPLPVNIITHILGTPFEEAALLRSWTTDLGLGFDSTISDPAVKERGVNALREMTAYFAELIARPKHPPGSIIEALVNDTASMKCSRQEAMAQCMLLLLAGHETTLNMLGNGLYALLSHPAEMAKLRQHPKLMDSMINESLRFETPLQRAIFRVAHAPLQLHAQELNVGERVSAVLSAANRDPAQFAEPDRFDIERRPNRHLSFGLGIHRCLGEKLARSEGRIAFGRLLERCQNLELTDQKPRWRPLSLFRALQSLPIKVS